MATLRMPNDNDARIDAHYAPPLAVEAPRKRKKRKRDAPGLGVSLTTWIFATIVITRAALAALTHVIPLTEPTLDLIKGALGVLTLGGVVAGLVWLHGAFLRLPQRTLNEANVTPAGAVGRLFIPFYNAYWLFA